MAARSYTIDIAKGLGILLVVFGHSWMVLHEKGELFRVIYSFHVPLFFFLSGIFINGSQDLKGFVLSKGDALLKPYLIVLLFLGADEMTLGLASYGKYLAGVVYASGFTIAWAPLWFLPHLFVASLLCWAVVRAIKNIKCGEAWLVLISLSMLVIGALFIDLFWLVDLSMFGGPKTVFGKVMRLPGLPFSLDIVFLSSAFGLLGYLVREHVKSMRFCLPKFVAAVVMFSLLHYWFDQTMDLNKRLYGDVLISSLQAVSGIYIVMSLSALIARYHAIARLLAYVGSCSIFILIFHSATQAKVYTILCGLSGLGVLNGLLAFIVGVTAPIIFLEIARRLRLPAAMLLPRKSGPSLRRTAGCH